MKYEVKEPFVRSTGEVKKSNRFASYKVHGFWDGAYAGVTQDWDYESGTWKGICVSWASGGRDRKEEPDDVVAAECLAAAITDAVEYARTAWKV